MNKSFYPNEILEDTVITTKIYELESEISKVLGLEELDAHIYLNLLRMGPLTASVLSKELGIDRTRVYRTIDKLINLKIVSTTFSRPKLCVANKPEDVLKSILDNKESQIKKIRNGKDFLIESINDMIPTNYTSSLPTFHITQGTFNIYSDIEQLLEKATGLVYIITTLKDLSKMYHTNIPEKIKLCEKNGAQVRLVTQVFGEELLPFVSRFGATETRLGGLCSKGRMIVEEGKQMIMSDAVWDDSEQQNIQSDYAICTNSSEMVYNIFMLSGFIWEKSKKLEMFLSKSKWNIQK